jgi:hypothetical protein
VRAMKISAATQLRSGMRRGPRRGDGPALAAAVAGCAATAQRARVSPPGCSWPGASQDQPEPLKRQQAVPECPLRGRREPPACCARPDHLFRQGSGKVSLWPMRVV